MTLISDTLHYRPDGTVSGVTRVVRETYKTPSGRDVVEDVSSPVDLSAVTDQLGAAYAAFDAHNKALEAQIETERKSAGDEKAALQEALAAKDAALEAATASR